MPELNTNASLSYYVKGFKMEKANEGENLQHFVILIIL